MSKSYKKAIYKDSGGRGNHKRLRKILRNSQKNFIRSHYNELITGEIVIPNDKSVVNQWDYSDYKIDCEHRRSFWSSRKYEDLEKYFYWKKKLSRK